MVKVVRIIIVYVLLITSLIFAYRVDQRIVVPMILFAMAMSAMSYRGE